MHISDGVLSPCVVGIGWAVALPKLAYQFDAYELSK